MSIQRLSDERLPAGIGVRRRHDAMSMILHWLTLLLLLVLFGTNWARGQVSDGNMAALLLNLHRSAGGLVWAVTLVRLAWRARELRGRRRSLTGSGLRFWAARTNACALYVLLIVQPLSGFMQSVARGRGFPMLGFPIPSIMGRDRDLTHLAHKIHELGASILLALVGLHVAAALFHGLVLRDEVLSSMLPGRRRALAK